MVIFQLLQPLAARLALDDSDLRMQSTEANPAPQTISARVVHIAEDRIYLDCGFRQGLRLGWEVIIVSDQGDSAFLKLDWCNEDLSSFRVVGTRPPLVVGDSLPLRGPGKASERINSLSLANSEYPALPHEAARSIPDLELRAWLCHPAADIIQEISVIAIPNSNLRALSVKIKDGLYFSDGSPITAEDLFYSLEFLFRRPNLESVALKYLGMTVYKLY